MPSPQPTPSTTHLPRILCLHGGGVTGEIFRLQSRALIAALSPYFRLVYADGPFFCPAGPGMIPVYANHGPYRRWLRWLPEHAPVDDDAAIEEVEYAMRTAMQGDTEGTGKWVGLMGFSQGAKMAASVLYERQLRMAEQARASGALDGMYGGEGEAETVLGLAGGEWEFAVCMAGRAPLVMLSERRTESRTMVRAGGISEGFDFDGAGVNTDKLALPSLHVHGTADPGLHLHRRLLNDYCSPGSTTLVEWPGDHRIPLKGDDVRPVVQAILELAKVSEIRSSLLEMFKADFGTQRAGVLSEIPEAS